MAIVLPSAKVKVAVPGGLAGGFCARASELNTTTVTMMAANVRLFCIALSLRTAKGVVTARLYYSHSTGTIQSGDERLGRKARGTGALRVPHGRRSRAIGGSARLAD